MDWKTWIGPVASILAVVVTNWLATHRFERERKYKRADELRELYIKWVAGARSWLAYSAYGGSNPPTEDMLRIRLQLEFLDDDEKTHELRMATWEAIPDPGTSDHADLQHIADGNPDWGWPRFDNAMIALMAHLKKRKL
jgi:hypothetical protein